jgi:hypothetical protein
MRECRHQVVYTRSKKKQYSSSGSCCSRDMLHRTCMGQEHGMRPSHHKTCSCARVLHVHMCGQATADRLHAKPRVSETGSGTLSVFPGINIPGIKSSPAARRVLDVAGGTAEARACSSCIMLSTCAVFSVCVRVCVNVQMSISG